MFKGAKTIVKILSGLIVVITLAYLIGILFGKTLNENKNGYPYMVEKDGVELSYNIKKEGGDLRLKVLLKNNNKNTVIGIANDSCSNFISVSSKTGEGNWINFNIDTIVPKPSVDTCLAAEWDKPLKPGEKDREEVVISPEAYDGTKTPDGWYTLIIRTSFIDKTINVEIKDGKFVDIENN